MAEEQESPSNNSVKEQSDAASLESIIARRIISCVPDSSTPAFDGDEAVDRDHGSQHPANFPDGPEGQVPDWTDILRNCDVQLVDRVDWNNVARKLRDGYDDIVTQVQTTEYTTKVFLLFCLILQTAGLANDGGATGHDAPTAQPTRGSESTPERIAREQMESEDMEQDLDIAQIAPEGSDSANLRNDRSEFGVLSGCPVGQLVDRILASATCPPDCEKPDEWEKTEYWVVTRYKKEFEEELRRRGDHREVYASWGKTTPETNGRCLGHCHELRERRETNRLPAPKSRRFCATTGNNVREICRYHWRACDVRSLSLEKEKPTNAEGLSPDGARGAPVKKLRVSKNLIGGKKPTCGCSSRIEEHVATPTDVGRNRFLKLADLDGVDFNKENQNIAVLLEVCYPKSSQSKEVKKPPKKARR